MAEHEGQADETQPSSDDGSGDKEPEGGRAIALAGMPHTNEDGLEGPVEPESSGPQQSGAEPSVDTYPAGPTLEGPGQPWNQGADDARSEELGQPSAQESDVTED